MYYSTLGRSLSVTGITIEIVFNNSHIFYKMAYCFFQKSDPLYQRSFCVSNYYPFLPTAIYINLYLLSCSTSFFFQKWVIPKKLFCSSNLIHFSKKSLGCSLLLDITDFLIQKLFYSSKI